MRKFANSLAIFILLSFGPLLANLAVADAPLLGAPEVVTAKFYKWYLRSISQDKDPLTEDRSGLRIYVSKALIQEIERKQNSADGLEQDYFIQAQDYLDDWEGNISAKSQPIEGTTAKVIVTLGASKESSHHLGVTLIRENDAWKIREVHRVLSPTTAVNPPSTCGTSCNH